MGNKSILMSIQPQWVCKILNGEKTIEVRKKFPKDYVGWVYIYCTKGKRNGDNWLRKYPFCLSKNIYQVQDDNFNALNGYVVARFWCDKVEEIKLPYTKFGSSERVNGEVERTLQTQAMDEKTLLNKSCLSEEEIYKYLNFKHSPNYCGCAIHILKLDVFDKPKELSEFGVVKAPQNFCYVEDTL